jgi:hypothetical protein
MTLWNATPRCSFYIRTRVSDAPTYTYDKVSQSGPDGSLTILTPPSIGDLVHLADRLTGYSDTCRVIDRAWWHVQYGSVSWPYGQAQPSQGPILHIIVEATEGPFPHEAPEPDEP